MIAKREVKHCKHSSCSLEGLDASLPNDCAFCAHEQLAALADALESLIGAIDEGHFGGDPYYRDVQKAVLATARAALLAAGR